MLGSIFRKLMICAGALTVAAVLTTPTLADKNDHGGVKIKSKSSPFIARLNIGDPDITVVQNGPLSVLVRCTPYKDGARATVILTSDEPFLRGKTYPAYSEVILITAIDFSPATSSNYSTAAGTGFMTEDGRRAILFVRDMPVSFFQFDIDCSVHGEAVALREKKKRDDRD